MNSAIIFSLLLALMLTGMPVSIALGLTVLTFLFTMTTVPVTSVALKLFTGIERFEIMAIPFFILAGNLMNNAGITNRIYNFALALVGWLKGGLGHVNIIGSVIFAGMSGTANVIIASSPNALTVPNLAVKTASGRRYLTVMKDGQQVDTEVTFGISNDTVTEVLTGVQEGDIVVLPQPRATATNAGGRGIQFGGGGGGNPVPGR